MKKTIFLIGLLIAFSANAKDCQKEADNGGMAAMRECLITESENPVTVSYNNLIKALGTHQDAIDAIKKAQDGWLRFRDSTCDYISVVDNLDESANCKVDFNTAREKILKKYEKQARGKS